MCSSSASLSWRAQLADRRRSIHPCTARNTKTDSSAKNQAWCDSMMVCFLRGVYCRLFDWWAMVLIWIDSAHNPNKSLLIRMQDHSTIIDRSPSTFTAKEVHVSNSLINQEETSLLWVSWMPKWRTISMLPVESWRTVWILTTYVR